MIRRSILVVASALLLALPAGLAAHEPGAGGECGGYAESAGVPGVAAAAWGSDGTGELAEPGGHPPFLVQAGPAYMVGDYGLFGGYYVMSWWIYEESNGVDGLQRHDGWCYTAGFEDPDAADTILF